MTGARWMKATPPKNQMRRVYFRQILEYETMYAVIITGGKQYPVTKDQVLSIEKLPIAEGGAVY
jgi:hypothetical protein